MQEKLNIVIFEDQIARSRVFKPLTYNRSVAELRSGMYSLVKRLSHHNLYLHCEPHLAPLLRERYPEHKVNDVPDDNNIILINARCTEPELALRELEAIDKDHIHLANPDGDIVINRTRTGLPEAKKEMFRNGDVAEFKPMGESTVRLRTSLWEMIHHNPNQIETDIANLDKSHYLSADKFLGVFAIHPEKIFIAKTARIAPTVVLDASKGSIIIEPGATIQPHTSIFGPVVIAQNSLVKAGAKIYGGTTIGSVSKVGGEIENSIIQGFSNKQHDGYLGHSFIGEWCNLGAGTNTSDLRNDYGNVSVKIEGENFDTGMMFVGLMMGDHSKSAIGTQFNTGTSIGAHCNIFGAGFPPKWIPSFSWGGAQKVMKYDMEKALGVAETVVARRGKVLTDTERDLWMNLR